MKSIHKGMKLVNTFDEVKKITNMLKDKNEIYTIIFTGVAFCVTAKHKVLRKIFKQLKNKDEENERRKESTMDKKLYL